MFIPLFANALRMFGTNFPHTFAVIDFFSVKRCRYSVVSVDVSDFLQLF